MNESVEGVTDRPSLTVSGNLRLPRPMHAKAMYAIGLAVVAISWVFSVCAQAQEVDTVNIQEEYRRKVDSSRSLQPLDFGLFGESINTYNGSVAFSVTDIDIPGNSELQVALARRFDVNEVRGRSARPRSGSGMFRDWQIDLPRLSGIFAASTGWIAGTTAGLRCAQPNRTAAAPPTIGSFQPDDYWSGNSLHLPGEGGTPLLHVNSARTDKPTDGATYFWTTESGWYFSCAPANIGGDAFVGRAPDGTKYWFTHIYDNAFSAARKGLEALPRREVTILPVRVEDRFGNSVTYTYSASEPGNITSIRANDGRQITFTYDRTDGSGFVRSASDGTRTWSYQYTDAVMGGTLTGVVRPDNSRWAYDFSAFHRENADNTGTSCGTPGGAIGLEFVASVTHPSGAKGEFTFSNIFHGRSYVPRNCWATEFDSGDRYPPFHFAISITKKTISGAGMTASQWSWTYPPLGFSYDFQCSAGQCPTTKTIRQSNPDGSTEHQTFGIRYGVNDGMLLRSDVIAPDGSTTLRSTSYSYLTDPAGQQYPAKFGDPIKIYNEPTAGRPRPLNGRTVVQQSATFSWSVKSSNGIFSFDARARPTQVVSSSSLGFSKSEAFAYHDNTSLWVIGQLQRQEVNGTEMLRTAFDARANPIQIFRFGVLAQRFGYHPDGMMATASDGKGQTTQLSNWYRGVPRSISYPDGTTQSATVSVEGWLTSVTDQNGLTTSYTHDSMGRTTSIVYPSGPGENYTPSTLSLKQLTASDWMPTGIVPGMWQSAEVRGNLVSASYHDALFRPTATVEWDQTSGTTTYRSTRTSYDAAGRVAFQSYPIGGGEPSSVGTRTLYDALGRVTSVSEDSELGALTTTTEYLPGFQTRVTDPKGGQTTTTRYLAYGEPSTELPISITQPGDVVTEITRDVFGKPTQLRRRNTSGSIQTDRRYAYDAQQRLCKQIDPETRATIFDYDANGNVIWTATGLGLTANATSCERNAVGASDKTTRTYDAMNRVTLVDFPDASVDVSTAYTPDGLVAALGAGPHVWKYTYNRLRMPTQERLEHTFQGVVYPYPTQWTYDALGHRASMIAGNGITVAYSPNALGQPTQAGLYATGAIYHPDGSLKSFTYGNGAVRTVEKNARLLPSRIADLRGGQTIVDDRYVYDRNGNLTNQDDALNLAGGDRSLTYDARDRLTSAQISGTMTESFTYDALDNITSRQFGNQLSTYNYDSQRRLSSIIGPSVTQSFGYDVRGNMTSRANLAHTFDRANRLTAVTGRGNYEYDGHGRRTVSWRADGTGKTDLYDLSGVLRMTGDNRRRGNTVYVHLGSQLVAEHFRGWDGSNEAIEYVHGDLLGTSVARTTGTGAITERERSMSFGQALDGSKREAPGFTGHMEDPGLGLIYMQQRYYDPTIGRFLSVDPVGPLEDPINHFGRYHYGNNNPYRFTDPDGRRSFENFFAELMGANKEDPGYDRAQAIVTRDVTAPVRNAEQKISEAQQKAGVALGSVANASPVELKFVGGAKGIAGVGGLSAEGSTELNIDPLTGKASSSCQISSCVHWGIGAIASADGGVSVEAGSVASNVGDYYWGLSLDAAFLFQAGVDADVSQTGLAVSATGSPASTPGGQFTGKMCRVEYSGSCN